LLFAVIGISASNLHSLAPVSFRVRHSIDQLVNDTWGQRIITLT